MPDRVIGIINGPRGSVLLAVAWVCALHGVAYTPLTDGPITIPIGLQALSEVIPLEVYGVLWFVTAILTVIGAFRGKNGRQRDHADAWGYGLSAGMFAAWGFSYVAGWTVALSNGAPSRAWVTGCIYLAFAVVITAAARMTNPRTTGRRRRRGRP